MNTSRKILTICVIACCPSVGLAEIIYSQTTPEEPIAAFGSVNSEGAPKIADNFSFAGDEAKTIRSVRFIGSPLLTEDELLMNNIRITFFEDDGGLPGTPLIGGDFSVANAVLQKFTGGPLLNGVSIPVEYVADLGDGIEVNPSNEYWMSISNAPIPDLAWAWARANGLMDQRIAGTINNDDGSQSWVISSSQSGMWFELRTTNIPEPESFFLLISGLVGFWCIKGKCC